MTLLLNINGLAQNATVSAKFIVIDSIENSPIPFAHLKWTHTETSQTFYSISNENGKGFTKKMPVGKYALKTTFIGYEPSLDTLYIAFDSPRIKVILRTTSTQLVEKEIAVDGSSIGSIGVMKPIEGVLIAKGKKAQLIRVQDVKGNLANFNSRELFATIPGLNIWESDNAGLQLGIGGRGLNPSRTSNYNTRQDGAEMSADALGYPESYYIPPAQAIKEIQVIKGAASLQFGPQFGGLLNFKLKHGDRYKPMTGTFEKMWGSFNVNSTYLDFGGSSRTWQYFFYFNHKTGESWRPNGNFETFNGGLRVRKYITDRTSVDFNFSKLNYLAKQPGGLTDNEFNSDPLQSKRDRNWFAVDWNLWSANFNHEFHSRLKLSSKFFGLQASRKTVGFLGQINRTDPLQERDLIAGNYQNWGNETRLLKLFDIRNYTQALLIGVRYYQGFSNSQQGFADSTASANFNFLDKQELAYSNYDFPSRNASFFVEQIFNIGSKTSIIPGVRFEYINTAAEGNYKDLNFDLAGNLLFDTLLNENRKNERSFVIAGIGITHKLKGDTLQVYGNFSQNYRSINFTDMQIINPNFRIDPNLQDERGFNMDLGFKGFVKERLYFDVSLFALYYNNRIGNTLRTDSTLFNTYQYRTNVSNSIATGVESILFLNFIKKESPYNLNGFLNYSYTYGRYLSKDSLFQGNTLELVPEVNWKSGVEFKYKKTGVKYQVSYTHWQFSDASNSLGSANAVVGVIPAYTVMDLSLFTEIEDLSLTVGINNLLNNNYFTRRATAYPGPGIIPSAPRNLYFTLNYNF